MRLDEATIHAAHANGGDSELAAQREQPRVDKAVQHHAGRVDCGSIRDPATLHHARLDAHLRRDFVQLRTAAVDEHDPDAEVVQDRNLLHERAHGRHVAERTAAGLDDEDLALVHVDVRRRAPERTHSHGLFAFVSDHRLSHPFSRR